MNTQTPSEPAPGYHRDRAALEPVIDDVTTGASNHRSRATRQSQHRVTARGSSDCGYAAALHGAENRFPGYAPGREQTVAGAD